MSTPTNSAGTVFSPEGMRQLLLGSYDAAVAAACPLKIVAGHLPTHEHIRQYKRTWVIGAGKAAASMAMAVEQHWPSDASLQGLVITRYGHGLPCQRISVIEAGHPVPDEAGEKAAQAIFDMAANADSDDLVLVLVSGGGSSLLSLPANDISMADLKLLTKQLLASGAPIQDMNVVRKHLSRIQGGRLAQACRAPMITLVISDVVGDDLSAIASGPTVPDPSTYADAVAILEKFKVIPPASIATRLARGVAGSESETPKAGDACFAGSHSYLIATAKASLAAAAQLFTNTGFRILVLGDDIEGEAREVGADFAQRLEAFVSDAGGLPLAVISGGECTVTLNGHAGRGGRCTEFLLGFADRLQNADREPFANRVYALAADTDGIDGSEDNAGALLTPDTLDRALASSLQTKDYLAGNDAYGYFEALGDLVVKGPTLTNVNDYRVIVIT